MDWRKKINTGKNNNHFQPNIDWINKMNNAITHIEKNLLNEVDYEEVAKIACCSTYHFQRFFSFIANISITEYIRRRRLTIAAFELQNSNDKIIDIAFKYGYESPEAFTRAFKILHGVTPSLAKNKGTKLKAFPCINFHILIKGDIEMNYRIEEKTPFNFFGITTNINTIDGQNNVLIPEFWQNCRLDGSIDKIRKEINLETNTPLHAAVYNCTDVSHSYLIGYFTFDNIISDDFSVINIPKNKWAIFYSEELDLIEVSEQSAIMWKRIFTEWFATSLYELADAPQFEIHYKKNNDKYITEIWIPIISK